MIQITWILVALLPISSFAIHGIFAKQSSSSVTLSEHKTYLDAIQENIQ